LKSKDVELEVVSGQTFLNQRTVKHWNSLPEHVVSVVLRTIRYDTIEEINVDSKAEYRA